MRSSISSSRLIPSAAVVFVVATALYAWAAERWFPGGVPAAYQQRSNAIAVEKWLHAPGDWSVVLLGSSMSAVLEPAHLPAGTYNLSLSSLGAQTGLEILARSRRVPPMVLIEANVTTFIASDHALVSSSFAPATFAVRQWLPVARHDHQPIALLDEVLRRRVARGKSEADYVMPKPLYEQRIVQLAAAQATWPTETVSADLERLTTLLHDLRARGSRVVFFETPMDARLRDTAQTAGARRLLTNAFPSGEYEWARAPDWRDYQTSDGLHLVPESAARFARYLGLEARR